MRETAQVPQARGLLVGLGYGGMTGGGPAFNVAIGLLGGAITGIGVGFYQAQSFRFTALGLAAFAAAVVVWTSFGTVIGLTCSQTWHFRLAALQLAARGEGPVNLMRFLRDAANRDVLRTAGGAYQFRHARPQDLLTRGLPERAGPGTRSSLRLAR